MLINFTKMHGLGNDFMVIDNTAGNVNLNAEKINTLANRHFGVGFDQLLMVESTRTPGIDFRYVIYNANGGEVEQCGNGARCFARFVHDKGLTTLNPIKVQTHSGVIELHINIDDSVTVNMGKPSFLPADIGLSQPQQNTYQIQGYTVGVVSMGNPHVVLVVDDISINIEPIAQKIQQSSLLKNSANIGFMQIVNRDEIRLRVYERGAAETLACGSGACAAVAFAIKKGWLNTSVVVGLSGGNAKISQHKTGAMFLSGPAQFVFNGVIEV